MVEWRSLGAEGNLNVSLATPHEGGSVTGPPDTLPTNRTSAFSSRNSRAAREGRVYSSRTFRELDHGTLATGTSQPQDFDIPKAVSAVLRTRCYTTHAIGHSVESVSASTGGVRYQLG